MPSGTVPSVIADHWRILTGPTTTGGDAQVRDCGAGCTGRHGCERLERSAPGCDGKRKTSMWRGSVLGLASDTGRAIRRSSPATRNGMFAIPPTARMPRPSCQPTLDHPLAVAVVWRTRTRTASPKCLPTPAKRRLY